MWETKASELFTKAINELTTNGWTAKRITDLTYELTDANGVVTLGTCYIEQFPARERYSVFIKIGDALASCGTVALDADGLLQAYDIDGNIYTAKKECCVCKSTKDLYSVTPSGGGAYIVKTFCQSCLDSGLDTNSNYCSECGDFTVVIKDVCNKCATTARAVRDSWEQSNVCSRCNGKLDQHAIEIDQIICAACQTIDDFII